jgi:hypothetical protein
LNEAILKAPIEAARELVEGKLFPEIAAYFTLFG